MLTTRQAGRAKVPNNEMKSPLENQPNTRGYEIAVAFIATTLTAFLLFLFRYPRFLSQVVRAYRPLWKMEIPGGKLRRLQSAIFVLTQFVLIPQSNSLA
jgi:hypothetical protein